MKRRILSLFVATAMLFTTVLGTMPATVAEAATTESATITVLGKEEVSKVGNLADNGATVVTEDSYSPSGYCQIANNWYGNGLWNVEFDEAGVYDISFLASAKAAIEKFYIGMSKTEDIESSENSNPPFSQVTVGTYFSDTQGRLAEFDDLGISVAIRKAGKYTFKVGINWDGFTPPEVDPELKIAEIRFTQTVDSNAVYTVGADKTTELPSSVLLNPVESADDYGDYKLDVKKSGDYTLTYQIPSWGWSDNDIFNAGAQETFKAIVNPGTDKETAYSPVKFMHLWDNGISVKSTVHLEEGEQTLRIQALCGGYSIPKISIQKAAVHEIADENTIIPAAEYQNAIGANAVAAAGNLCYTEADMQVDYKIDVKKSGVYTISYESLADKGGELQTLLDGEAVAASDVPEFTGEGNWYESTYVDTDTTGVSFRLEKGEHTLSTVFGAGDINLMSLTLTCTEEDPGTIIYEVEGEDALGGWVATAVKPEDGSTGYLEYAGGQRWANGRWINEFKYPGDYQLKLVVSTTAEMGQTHLEMGPTLGKDTLLPDQGSEWTVSIDNIALENTNGEFKTITGPTVKITDPGFYDIKYGDWGTEVPSFKLDKIIFTFTNAKAQPQVVKEPLTVEKGKQLVVKEANAVQNNGSLKLNVKKGNYVDYQLEVQEAGDYRLTYDVPPIEEAIEEAFCVMAAPLSEDKAAELGEKDFVTKLEPVEYTKFYDAVSLRQCIHLEAGSYILRVKALSDGAVLSQFTITDAVVWDVAGDEGVTTIAATEFNHAIGYHAIQGVTNDDTGNVGYGKKGLVVDFDLNAPQAGTYAVVYNYVAAGDYSLTTQRVDVSNVYNMAVSKLEKSIPKADAEPNDQYWYKCDWTSSEAQNIFLSEGANKLRVRWDSVDINLRSISLGYNEDGTVYVKELLTELPDVDKITLKNEEAVNTAAYFYDVLTKEQQESVETELPGKLEGAKNKIANLKLQEVRDAGIKALDKAFAKYQESDYKTDAWEQIKEAYQTGTSAINDATSADDVNTALEAAKTAMAAVEKKLKSLELTADNTIILTENKAYRKEGSLSSDVDVNNYVDYFVNVKEAGTYTFTYALYAQEAIEDAFAIKYDISEYPEEITNEYAKVSVPKIVPQGSLVKEICTTVTLEAGEQTIRFEALSDKIRLNRITIRKQKPIELTLDSKVSARDFSEASGSYVMANTMVTETAADTELRYLVSLEEAVRGYLSYNYAYAGEKEPKLVLSMGDEDGIETISSVLLTDSDGKFVDSKQTEVTLPAGEYVLCVKMADDGVDLKNFVVSSKPWNVPAEDITLNAYKTIMNLNTRFKLSAELEPVDATSEIHFKSDKPEIASVDADGVVTAKALGKAVITVSAGEAEAQCEITVKDDENVWQVVTLNAGKIQLNPQGSFQLTASVEPLDFGNAAVTFKSSNPAVATVDANGLIKAIKAGNAVITATAAEGGTAKCEVTVVSAAGSQTVAPSFIQKVETSISKDVLYTGGDTEKKAKIEVVVPTGAKLASLKCRSDNTSVATVSATGAVTAKKPGKAVITINVRLENGESASIQKVVTVKKAYIKLQKAKYSVKKGKTIQLKAKAYGSSKKITFSIGNANGKKLAKLTKSGRFTAKAKGSVKVIAKSGKVKKSFSVKIK